MTTFTYAGQTFPRFLKDGNAMRFIAPVAREILTGHGLDVGCGRWPLEHPGALSITPVDVATGGDAMNLPERETGWDFIFSSHCLEHLVDPIGALQHWKRRLTKTVPAQALGSCLFLYLPHPDMVYWRPQHCRKHLHIWRPGEMAEILCDLGFQNVIYSERDLAWSFAAVGWLLGEGTP